MSPLVEALILIGVGVLALLLGKRLFWLFAGVAGFALGWWLTSLWLPPDTDPVFRVFVGVIAGAVLMGLARFLGVWSIRLVAMAAGFVLLPLVLGNLRMMSGVSELVWAILGAVLGLVLAWAASGWTLIVMSSILGAVLMVNGARILVLDRTQAPLAESVQLVIGVVLAVLGIIVQSRRKI